MPRVLALGGREGGREFESITNGTLERDLYVMDRIRAAGLVNIEVRAGETPEDFAERLLGELIAGGAIFDLLGGWIVPKGMSATDWSPEVARETARYLKGITSEEDKAKVRVLILEIMIDFFARGTVSLWSSRGSSGESSPESGKRASAEPNGSASGLGSSAR